MQAQWEELPGPVIKVREESTHRVGGCAPHWGPHTGGGYHVRAVRFVLQGAQRTMVCVPPVYNAQRPDSACSRKGCVDDDRGVNKTLTHY